MNVFRQKTYMSLLACWLLTMLVSGASTQTLTGLSTPPPDSAEAWRVRIWIPVERDSKCRVTVDILNETERVVRHLIDFRPGRGYHNLYWDKRDDSGRQVLPGTYTGLVNNCGEKQRRPIVAQFNRWERSSRINPIDTTRPFMIDLELLEDSASISVHILNQRGIVIDSVFVDSIFNKGHHQSEWQPERKIIRGNYMIRVMIGEYTYVRELTYIP